VLFLCGVDSWRDKLLIRCFGVDFGEVVVLKLEDLIPGL
jgi:hypothetical protein